MRPKRLKLLISRLRRLGRSKPVDWSLRLEPTVITLALLLSAYQTYQSRIDRTEDLSRAERLRREDGERAETIRQADIARAESTRLADIERAEDQRRADKLSAEEARRDDLGRSDRLRQSDLARSREDRRAERRALLTFTVKSLKQKPHWPPGADQRLAPASDVSAEVVLSVVNTGLTPATKIKVTAYAAWYSYDRIDSPQSDLDRFVDDMLTQLRGDGVPRPIRAGSGLHESVIEGAVYYEEFGTLNPGDTIVFTSEPTIVRGIESTTSRRSTAGAWLVFGVVQYQDVFGSTPEHRTEGCTAVVRQLQDREDDTVPESELFFCGAHSFLN